MRSTSQLMTTVTLYFAPDCSLCGPVHELLERLRPELGFELEEVDVSGVPELERRYRAWLPVVEIDGERAFVYGVEEHELRERLAGSRA
jgi:glutaredoxin